MHLLVIVVSWVLLAIYLGESSSIYPYAMLKATSSLLSLYPLVTATHGVRFLRWERGMRESERFESEREREREAEWWEKELKKNKIKAGSNFLAI